MARTPSAQQVSPSGAAVDPGHRSDWLKRAAGSQSGAISFICFVLLWQFATVVLQTPDYLLPSPSRIVVDAIGNWKLLAIHTGITTFEVIVGFLLSILIGLPLAAVFAYSRSVEKTFFPLIVGWNTVPKVALAPILLAWFGFGLKPKILIVVLVAFFPIVINSVVGLKSTSPQMIHLARSMGATASQVFWRFQLPNALPGIFAGLKIATSLSVIGAVVGEFVGADSGLGYVMMIANSDLNIARQFAAIVILSFIGVAFFWIIEGIERLVLPWHVSIRADTAE